MPHLEVKVGWDETIDRYKNPGIYFFYYEQYPDIAPIDAKALTLAGAEALVDKMLQEEDQRLKGIYDFEVVCDQRQDDVRDRQILTHRRADAYKIQFDFVEDESNSIYNYFKNWLDFLNHEPQSQDGIDHLSRVEDEFVLNELRKLTPPQFESAFTEKDLEQLKTLYPNTWQRYVPLGFDPDLFNKNSNYAAEYVPSDIPAQKPVEHILLKSVITRDGVSFAEMLKTIA